MRKAMLCAYLNTECQTLDSLKGDQSPILVPSWKRKKQPL